MLGTSIDLCSGNIYRHHPTGSSITYSKWLTINHIFLMRNLRVIFKVKGLFFFNPPDVFRVKAGDVSDLLTLKLRILCGDKRCIAREQVNKTTIVHSFFSKSSTQ